ncbi:MAG: amino acid--[acyl-carrier-protein] ligase [Actinomycetota bacterium]
MSLEEAQRRFRSSLIEAGLLLASGVDGLYARSGTYEDIVEGIDRLVVAAGSDQAATRLRFPPLLPRPLFARTGYLASFPQLMGSVHSFTGNDKEHAALLALAEAGERWESALTPTELMLTPAACHPVYPLYSGTLPAAGVIVDVYGYCFRHEPSIDPARMQAFRMHEYVYLGSPDAAEKHRDMWVDRGMELLESLALQAESMPANDPFFGRGGRLLAFSQRDAGLKTELAVHLYDDESWTAVVSGNCHHDHFGAEFGIMSADGAVAHSSCIGFGVDRIALALLARHGLDPARWPPAVRERLWP